MYESYILDLLSLGLRWLHVIVGIAWIGSSFYFIWLDNSIREPEDQTLKDKGILGELWAMHAGGFYNPQKYAVAPKKLPDPLHFFFWPSYSTWITGFLLLTALYYLQASSYMIDPEHWITTPWIAVLVGLGTLATGWLVYDALCRLLIDRSQLLFAVVYTLFVAIMAFLLQHALSGRAAYIHVGAMIATAMSGNVFFIIIPGQRKIVAAMKRGEAPDPTFGKKSKQRSIHNNYFTLPVLFAMISNHYAFTYSSRNAWLVLVSIMVASAIIRHFFNLSHKGIWRWEYPVLGGAILLIVVCALAPVPAGMQTEDVHASDIKDRPVTLADVRPIIATRCTACHSAKPTLLPSAPAGLMFDTPEQINLQARRIHQQAVINQAMPQANRTKMTNHERAMIAAWMADGLLKERPPETDHGGSPGPVIVPPDAGEPSGR